MTLPCLLTPGLSGCDSAEPAPIPNRPGFEEAVRIPLRIPLSFPSLYVGSMSSLVSRLSLDSRRTLVVHPQRGLCSRFTSLSFFFYALKNHRLHDLRDRNDRRGYIPLSAHKAERLL